jgi:hypothetical protein
MRFENPTKWEIFLDGFHNFWNCLDCYNDGDTWGYDEFWEGLNLGWYMEYIYPYDDDFNPTTSHVRQLRLDAKPYVHTIYVSEEAYDKLVEAINAPPDPKVVERLKQIMSKPAPWDEENDTRR